MSETKSFVAIYFPETYVSYISVLVTYSNIYYIAIVRTFNLKLHQILVYLREVQTVYEIITYSQLKKFKRPPNCLRHDKTT